MAVLPADPRGRRNVLILIALLIVLGWWIGKTQILDRRQAQVAVLTRELEGLEAQNRRSRVLAARRDDLRSRMELLERQLRIFEEFIPQSEEVPELLDAISREATLTNVELSRIAPRAAEAAQYYTRQTWELAVLGDYHNIGRYLARIASLPRIIKPTNVQMRPAPQSRATRDMDAPLNVTLRIETFVLGPAEGARPQQGQGASSG